MANSVWLMDGGWGGSASSLRKLLVGPKVVSHVSKKIRGVSFHASRCASCPFLLTISLRYKLLKAMCEARMVFSISCVLWAVERKAASN
jgi:hypothetical protein